MDYIIIFWGWPLTKSAAVTECLQHLHGFLHCQVWFWAKNEVTIIRPIHLGVCLLQLSIGVWLLIVLYFSYFYPSSLSKQIQYNAVRSMRSSLHLSPPLFNCTLSFLVFNLRWPFHLEILHPKETTRIWESKIPKPLGVVCSCKTSRFVWNTGIAAAWYISQNFANFAKRAGHRSG